MMPSAIPNLRHVSHAEHQEAVQRALLVRLYDAGGTMPFADLVAAMPVPRRHIWRAINAQHMIGNVKRHRDGQPITLTASARSAIAAGRAMLTELREGIAA